MTTRLKIEKIWKEILALPELDPDRPFMDLGGTSLMANQLVARLASELSLTVAVIKVFEYPTLRQFCDFILGESSAPDDERPVVASRPAAPEHDVAIVGMACRFPGARNVDEFWKNLVEGKDSIEFFSEAELDASVPEELRKDPRLVKARGAIENPFGMDAKLFDVGPMEAKLIDPQQRVLLEVAFEALEHAGHGPGSFKGIAGVFAGNEDNTYYKNEILPFPEAEKRAGRFSIMTGNEKDFLAMHIAHKLDLRGPALSVNTACSTSLVAVIMACKSLRNGECDLALAGGSSVHFPTHDGYYFQEGGVFSPDGHCRPFDKDAQGTIFTDGAGIVVLKRLSDALRDNDTIYAVVKGGAINSDGGDKASFSAPSISGQSSCIVSALGDARVSADTIQFVEAHGTATPMGDPIEVEALRQAYRRYTSRSQFCGLGSVKSNIGHTTTAAGVASLIKMALALKHAKMPGTAHFKSPNPRIEIETSPFYVVKSLTDWRRGQGPRRAGISSFGIGGTNSHAILEEAPERTPSVRKDAASRPFEILPVSAKTPGQRDTLLERVGAETQPARDVAFTLQKGRTRFKARGARIRFTGLKAEDLTVSRDEALSDPELVLMFPGQGSQYIEMGKGLCATLPEFNRYFSEVCALIGAELGLDFQALIFDPNNKETLENTRYTQPALFAIETSMGRVLLDWGLKPDLMIGHSIGEFAAACLSGVFSLEDGVKLITARGRLMASLPTGKMLSVRGAIDDVLKAAGEPVDVASVNSPVHCVLAGPDAKIRELQERLEKAGFPCRPLHTSHAFHSAMMDPVVEPFFEVASKVKYSPPKFKIISTVAGEPLTDAQATDPRYWAQHLRATVRFSAALLKSIEAGGNLFVEVGPRTTLSSLALQHLKGREGAAFSTLADNPEAPAELGNFASALAKLWVHGLELDWDRIWTGGRRVATVTYPFERKNFRFSEGRKPEARLVATPIVADDVAVGEPTFETIEASIAPASTESLLEADLSKLFSEYAGLSFEDANATFVENGFDSLVLMQIGVEMGKRYGVSVSLRDLMEGKNTLKLLSAHVAKSASPDRLPRPAAPAPRKPAPRPAAPTAAPAASTTVAPSEMSQLLAQMKEVLELQLKVLTLSQTQTQTRTLAEAQSQTQKLKGLIRAKHESPPTTDAFRAKTPDGREAWYRFDPTTQKYQVLC